MGIGIIGTGNIVQIAHLPAYRAEGLPVIAAFDPNPAAVEAAQRIMPAIEAAPSVDAILVDDRIDVVDIATHPSVRSGLVEQALRAGKHVLSQKPFADDMETARRLVAVAAETGRKLAVNQNGRWAPAWNGATRLIEAGAIGDVMAVTHEFHKYDWWGIDTPFDKLEHAAIHDYAIHFIDISLVWMGGVLPQAVRARNYRTPTQPEESFTPWGAWIDLDFAGGRNAFVRAPGRVVGRAEGHAFEVFGTTGTLRGSELGSQALFLETFDRIEHIPLEGSWFPDAFAGPMLELQAAVREGRKPSHDATNNLLTISSTLAAVESAILDGAAVVPER
jgi:predicted dehydrogenase